MPAPLPPDFYLRDTAAVARDLVGARLARAEVVLEITEVEAYRGPADTASHARAGRTARNAPMFGPVGRAYVYLCYGIHSMLNVVAHRPDEAGAVLIRSARVLEGQATVADRRGGREGPDAVAGPGKVGAALALDVGWSHHDLTAPGGLELWPGERPELVAGPRVGIDYAAETDRTAPLRFARRGCPAVSHRRSLAPRLGGERLADRARRPTRGRGGDP